MTPPVKPRMTLAPITGRDYYESMLTIVDAVEMTSAHAVRKALLDELEAMEQLGLAEMIWTPQKEQR